MHFNRKLSVLGLIILVSIMGMLGWIRPALSSSSTTQKKVILVTIDRTSWEELQQYADQLKNLNSMAQSSAVGLMNTKTAGELVGANTFLTIGASSRLNGGTVGGQAFNLDEEINGRTAEELYQRRTDIAVGQATIVHPNLPAILNANSELRYPAQPGALGQVLHDHGLKTAVLGNADQGAELISRNGVSVAMDAYGRVDRGRVDNWTNRPAPRTLAGISTDYLKLLQAFKEVYTETDFIVVELGDLSRIDSLAQLALPQAVEQQRLEALKEIDQFVGELSGLIDPKQTLLGIVTPTPTAQKVQAKQWFTPIMMTGPGFEQGLLTSGTTKRNGIVANTDIAPTVLQFFGISKSPNMNGQGMGMGGAGSVQDLQATAQVSYYNYLARPILVQGYISLEIIVLAVALCAFLWQIPKTKYIMPILLSLTLVPLVFLFLPILQIYSIIPSIVIALLLVALLTILIIKITDNNLYGFLLINGLTCLGMLVDLWLGSPLMKKSVLGYDAMEGARYYGIGNEYMGVLIGATIMGTVLLNKFLTDKRKLWLGVTGIIYMIITYALAAPHLGTNVGGTIAAVAGFGFTYMFLLDIKPSKKSILSVALLMVLVVGGFIAFDLSRPQNLQSHIGRTASMLISGGWSHGITEAVDIIVRKMAVNIRLIKYTKWSKVVAANILLLAVVYWRLNKHYQVIKVQYPYVMKGFWGTSIGALAALVFNDSGIVAAATMVIFATAPVLWLVARQSGSDKN